MASISTASPSSRQGDQAQETKRQSLEESTSSSLTELHNSCRDVLELQLQTILDYARPRSTTIQDLLYPICRLLDDQLVRFAIWASDAEIDEGTLEVNNDGPRNEFSIEEGVPRSFGLVREALLGIDSSLGNIWKRWSEIMHNVEHAEGVARQALIIQTHLTVGYY
jgi:hypothetical protein